MTTIEDLERQVEALEADMPTRRGYAIHINDLDKKFQRLDEGQQRLEHGLQLLEGRFERLENKVDDGFLRIDQKLDALLAQSKIELD